MRQYHDLTVQRIDVETADSRRVSLGVPEHLSDVFRFTPGQHLPLEIEIEGKPVRRTYSICSVPGQLPLQIGVRLQPGGRFSDYVGERLAAGDTLRAMPPFGQFHASIDPAAERTLLMYAAGSGITPILSIMRTTLETETGSRILLFYGNRQQRSTMFIDDLYALKNRYPERLQLYFLFSREEQEFPVFSGRLDAEKIATLNRLFCAGLEPDEAWICGPDTMTDVVSAALVAQGLARTSIHVERFGAPRRSGVPRSDIRIDQKQDAATITVIMDGHRRSFTMPDAAENIVDGAALNGIDLPYSCKGGVCATCRTFVREGNVSMATNYGLEPWEVDKGFVLACQSQPLTAAVTLDYDKT